MSKKSAKYETIIRASDAAKEASDLYRLRYDEMQQARQMSEAADATLKQARDRFSQQIKGTRLTLPNIIRLQADVGVSPEDYPPVGLMNAADIVPGGAVISKVDWSGMTIGRVDHHELAYSDDSLKVRSRFAAGVLLGGNFGRKDVTGVSETHWNMNEFAIVDDVDPVELFKRDRFERNFPSGILVGDALIKWLAKSFIDGDLSQFEYSKTAQAVLHLTKIYPGNGYIDLIMKFAECLPDEINERLVYQLFNNTITTIAVAIASEARARDLSNEDLSTLYSFCLAIQPDARNILLSRVSSMHGGRESKLDTFAKVEVAVSKVLDNNNNRK
jgi:hypothetical protein